MDKRFLTFFLASTPLLAVVNIAPVDIGEAPGFSGHLAGSATTKRGNTEKDEYSASTRVQYDNGDRYVAWAALSYDYGEASGVTNEDKTYGHLRFIHTLYAPDWCVEAFVQTQHDKFKSIQTRTLGGGGVRWRFFDSQDWGKGYAGAGAFYEYATYSNPAVNASERNGRMNGYIAYTKAFGEGAHFSYIGYYQPRANDTADYIVSQTAELNLPIYRQLSLSFKLAYDYDAVPPVGVKKEDFVQSTSLVFEF